MKCGLRILMVVILIVSATALFVSVCNKVNAGVAGSGWITDKLVYESPSTDERAPVIATDHNGYLYVAFQHYFSSPGRYGISVSRSTDGGNSWSNFGEWYDSSYNLANPAIAIDPYNNRVYVAYELERSAHAPEDFDIYCRVYAPGTGWLPVVGVDVRLNYDDRFPSITSEYQYGESNRLYIAYESSFGYSVVDRDLMFAVSTDDGATWSTKKLHGDAPDDNVYCQTSITSAQGYIYIAYRYGADYNSICDVCVDRSSDFGDTWTPYKDVDGLTKNCQYPSIVAAHGGYSLVMVAFELYLFSGYADVGYSYSPNLGGSWSKGLYLADTAIYEGEVCLSVDGQGSTSDTVGGYVHAVYSSSPWGDIKYTKTHSSSPTSWSTVQTASDQRLAYSWYGGSITTQYRSGGGEYFPCVAWSEERDGSSSEDIYYSTPGSTYTFATNPAGLKVKVGGNQYTEPVSFNWPAGYSHTIEAPTQSIADTQYVFTNWNDANTNNPRTITVGTSDTTFTANFKKQFYIMVTSAHDSPTPSQWVDQGGSLTVSVSSPADDDGAGTRYSCAGYKIDGGNLQSGTSHTFTNVQTPFRIEFQWTPEYCFVVTSAHDSPNPSGTNWYDSGTPITASVTSPADDNGAGTRYICTGFTGTGSVFATGTSTSIYFVLAAPSTITWNWTPQYYLTVNTDPSGLSPQPTVSPSGLWYDSGTQVTLTAETVSGYSFGHWTVDDTSKGAGINQITVSMEAAHAATAHYTLSVADTTPPTITHTPISAANEGQAITISATITDNVAVTEARLYYRKTGETTYVSTTMTKSGDTYTGMIPASKVTTAGVQYYINATDGNNYATHPPTNPKTSPHVITVSAGNPPPAAVTLNNPSDITENSMKLTWSTSTEADFAKYEIYQSTSSGTLGTKVYETTDRSSTAYTATGLSASTAYYFTVRVVDASGQSADSIQVSGKTQPTAEAGATVPWVLWVVGGLIIILTATAIAIVVLTTRKK